MGLTITNKTVGGGIGNEVKIIGSNVVKMKPFNIDFDNSYPTGGESLDLSSYFKELINVQINPKSGYVFEYDYTNKKVMAYYGDNNNAADGPLIEVPNATDLSSLTGVRVIAWGI